MEPVELAPIRDGGEMLGGQGRLPACAMPAGLATVALWSGEPSPLDVLAMLEVPAIPDGLEMLEVDGDAELLESELIEEMLDVEPIVESELGAEAALLPTSDGWVVGMHPTVGVCTVGLVA